jgi:hypothetical protein
MGTPYPTHNTHGHRDESRLRDGDHRLRGNEPSLRGKDYAEEVLTLLEENARLRGLVVKLSDLVLRNVADQR